MTDTDIAAELEKPWTSVAHWQALGGQAAAAISALQAEKEALREQVVTVKPLEWEDTSRSFSGERLSAQTIFGVEYVCLWDDRSISWSVFIWGEWKGCGDAGGLEKAKAAAQADYERRILAALDTVSVAQVRKDALEEAYAALPNAGKDTDGKDAGEGYDEAVMDAKAALRALIEKEDG